MSRKEKRQIADAKRKLYKDKICYTFISTVMKGHENTNRTLEESLRFCLQYYHQFIQSTFIRRFPEDAHLIRSAAITAREEINHELIEYLI